MGKRGPQPDPASGRQIRLAQPARLVRPSAFDQAIADKFCDRLLEGESVRAIIFGDTGMPTHRTFYLWMDENPSFRSAVSRARELSAHAHADKGLEIADDPRAAESHEALGHAKIRSEYRKWYASKLAPGVYGDRVNVAGDLQLSVNVLRFGEAMPAALDVTPTYPPLPGSDAP